MFPKYPDCSDAVLEDRKSPVPPVPDTLDTHDRFPLPSVARTWSGVPSSVGSVRVTLADRLLGALTEM